MALDKVSNTFDNSSEALTQQFRIHFCYVKLNYNFASDSIELELINKNVINKRNNEMFRSSIYL